jgi:Aldo/keto reductase family
LLIAGRDIEGIGLGTAQFAFREGSAEDSVATVHAALRAGVRLIDTALAYTRSSIESYAEQVVARALRGITNDRPLVATRADIGVRATPSRSTGVREHSVRTARSACVAQIHWHRTPVCPFSAFLVSDLDRPFCHPECMFSQSVTPMHHQMIMVSSAAPSGGGLAGGGCRDAE